MTEQTRLISYLLYGLFSTILKEYNKNHQKFLTSDCASKRSFEVMFTEPMRWKPQDTVSLTMRHFLSLLHQDLGQI